MVTTIEEIITIVIRISNRECFIYDKNNRTCFFAVEELRSSMMDCRRNLINKYILMNDGKCLVLEDRTIRTRTRLSCIDDDNFAFFEDIFYKSHMRQSLRKKQIIYVLF